MSVSVVLLPFVLQVGSAFTVSRPWGTAAGTYSFALGPVIKWEDTDFEFDVGQGGVRLAEESALQVVGDVKHKPGTAKPQMHEMRRYTKVTEIKEEVVREALDGVGGSILTTGTGKEVYRDPGETVEKEVTYAPLDAIRDGLNAAASAMEADHVVINFCGGDELQVLEVLDAVEQLVLMLDVNTKCKIDFTSLCHPSFEPSTSASVTVVAIPQPKEAGDDDGGEAENLKIVSHTERAVMKGHVYCWDGKCYTVVEDDVNTATA